MNPVLQRISQAFGARRVARVYCNTVKQLRFMEGQTHAREMARHKGKPQYPEYVAWVERRAVG